MESLKDSLSIVMPAYNEAAVIREFVEEIDRDIAQRFESAEIVIVDDHSTDATSRVLDEVAAANPRVRVEHAERNRGHGPSLRRALELSTGDFIFHVDSDRQHVPTEFWDLWEKRHADLVLGVRTVRRDPSHRLLLTRLVRSVVRPIAGARISDPNVPFRLIRRELWREVAPFIPEGALAPSIFVSVATARLGRQIEEVPITHLPREHGVSTLRLLKLARFCAKGLWQLLVFSRTIKRHRAT